MPIRFRCVYCEKLLGIAHRKAGTIVSCPRCGEKLIVPNPNETAPAGNGASEGKGAKLFERDDIDELLEENPIYRQDGPKPHGPRPAQRPLPLPEPLASSREGTVEGATLPPIPIPLPPSPGLVLSPNRLTALVIGLVFLLATTFAVGLLIGRKMHY